MGENPCLSKNPLPCGLVFMNSCVVLVFGPAVANTTVPRAFVTFTGSSLIAFLYLAWMVGLPLIPNCDMKFGITLKIRHSSQKELLAKSYMLHETHKILNF